VLEQVLVEGVEQDVREIIDVEEPLPSATSHVRRAGADWLAERSRSCGQTP
jgi:hypothetical protein